MRLATEYPNGRVAYTKGKTDFIVRVMETAKQASKKAQQTDATYG
jgi:hypothetical protein